MHFGGAARLAGFCRDSVPMAVTISAIGVVPLFAEWRDPSLPVDRPVPHRAWLWSAVVRVGAAVVRLRAGGGRAVDDPPDDERPGRPAVDQPLGPGTGDHGLVRGRPGDVPRGRRGEAAVNSRIITELGFKLIVLAAIGLGVASHV
ncbi:Uncharacterised protein [Amycolatopsis camponoti]|uniref:Uncharacterized protein n=1 Tax=Amycolatopsis camponoti TaxID=2606593 RepID=A0A6I8M1W6_9PSEU|nr:Uncharacterised protein [Amycolatopsis camponoti]